MPLSSGTRLGPYEVVDLVGAGGMGEVYRARDPRLGREVAIKVLPAELAASPDRQQRFEREARAVAAISHPNILTVFDVGTSRTTPYVVTELLQGATLRERMRHRMPTPQQVLSFAAQVARGLDAAHAHGIVHRDIKPENVFVTVDGRVKVLDFGIAKLTQQLGSDGAETTESSPTGEGTVLGTAGYMSPEQVRGLSIDQRTDIFALGVVLYELLGGKHPFRRDSAVATVTAILEETPPELSTLTRGVPQAVSGIVRRCLEKDREQRFRSAHDLALSLEAVVGGPAGAVPQEVEERSPYPGLASFTEGDAAVFFGREAEAQAFWQRLQNRKLLAVIGPSGAGKTSFLRAGAAPSRPAGWGAIVCTPGGAPFRGLGRALVPELSGDAEALRALVDVDDPTTAYELVGRWRRRHGEALLVVDQFEELFTLNGKETQRSYADLLGRLAADGDVHVLLSLRDDFLIRCSEHPSLAAVFQDLTPLPALGCDGLLRALVEPAKKSGYRFEDEALVAEMVEAVAGARGALPLLAFAVSRLWEKRDRERKLLTRAAYREVGGVAGALAQHAEATMERVGSERQAIVREIFRNLVTAQGTRAVADRDELLSLFQDRAAAEDVLRQLVDARLLTSYDVEGAESQASRRCLEVVHESLLKAWPRLVRWQAQDEEGAVLRDQLRQAARLWQEKGRPADLLWSGMSFREYELWREHYPGKLTALEEAFAHAMVARALRQRRRRRWAAAGVAVALSFVLAAVSVLWQRAVREGRRAEAARVLALGQVELDRYPTAALAYARKSLEIADTTAARRFAVEALWRSPTARVLPVPANTWSLAWSPDGRRLAAYTFSDKVQVFEEDGGPPRAIGGYQTASSSARIEFSGKGDALVTQLPDDPTLRVVSFPEGKEIHRLGAEQLGFAPGFFGWSVHPDGIVFCPEGTGWWFTKMRDTAGTWRLWPWDGGPLRPLGAASGDRLFATDRDHRWLTLTRGSRVYLRPLAGPLGMPEREVASYHPSDEAGLGMSPAGNRLAVYDGGDRFAVWPLAAGAAPQARLLQLPRAGGGVTWDEAGSRIVRQQEDGRAAALWDLDGPPDAEPLMLRRPDAGVQQTRFHPRGNWLAVATDDVTLWAVAQPWVRVLSGHKQLVFQLAFTPDSKWLVSCANDNARRWPLDPAAGEVAPVSDLGTPWCYGIAVSPDGTQVLRGFGGVKLVPLQGAGGKWLVTEKWPTDFSHNAVAFDISGRRAAAAIGFSRPPARKLLRVWELPGATLKHEWPLLPPGEPDTPYGFTVDRMAFASDGRLLVTGPGGIRRFDVDSGASEWIWRLDDATTAVIATSGDGRLLAAAPLPRDTAASAGKIVKREWTGVFLFDGSGGSRRQIHSHGNQVRSVALDPAGRVLVTGDHAGIVRVGSVEGGEPHLLIGHRSSVSTVTVSPDGKWIASAAGSEIRLWPMPDLSKPPLHTLPYAELITRLRALTNLQVVADPALAAGYKLEVGPFPGWKDVPTW